MRLALGLVLAGVAATACSYNWATGAAEDAGAPDGAEREAGVDAPVDGEGEGEGDVDGGVDAEVDAGKDGPFDAPAEASFCDDLESQVASAKTNAINCLGVGGGCQSSVTDQCGCVVFVAQPSGPATSTYVNDIHELEDSGCPLGCGSCPQPIGASCLASSSGASCTPYF